MSSGSGADRDHEQLHQLLGAFVLGGLDPEEHRAFSQHVRRCPACQYEAGQLSGMPALLDLVEPASVTAAAAAGHGGAPLPAAEPPPPVPPDLLDRVRRERRRRRWRLAAAAAVLALVAGGVGASVGPLLARATAPPTRPLVAVATPAAAGQGDVPRVEIDLVTRGWGTQLDLRGSSLPAGEVLYLAVTDRWGQRYDVASWTGTPSGRTSLSAACWLKPSDIAQVEVHTGTGRSVATATA